jgi:hypothetical protein
VSIEAVTPVLSSINSEESERYDVLKLVLNLSYIMPIQIYFEVKSGSLVGCQYQFLPPKIGEFVCYK